MADPETNQESRAAPVRILLVDDEPNITKSLQRELRFEDFDVSAVNDPQEAMRIATASEFALIVSDNMMPDMTGLEFFSSLKVRFPNTRRILLTGQTEMARAIQAFNDGDIHRFVNKPWDPEALLNVIRTELKIYRENQEKTDSQVRLEHEAKQRAAQLKEIFVELKQTKTQLTLHEERSLARQMQLSPRLRKAAVLVVDNHGGIRELLVTTLRNAGMENVHSASSGPDALAHLQKSAPAAIVLAEWRLGDMDGLALFKSIRSSTFHSANVPFILLSTRENRAAVELAIESGVNAYLIKPFHLTALIEHMERLLPKSQAEEFEDKVRLFRGLFYVIVNADVDSRTRIQTLLSASGVQDLVTSPTGSKALRLIQDKKPDVVIYDCNVRDPAWHEVSDALRREGGCERAPALLVTSLTPVAAEYEEVNRHSIRAFLAGEPQRQKLFELIGTAIEERDQSGRSSS